MMHESKCRMMNKINYMKAEVAKLRIYISMVREYEKIRTIIIDIMRAY